MTERLARDKYVIGPNWFASGFELCPDLPRRLGVRIVEGKRSDRAGYEKFDAFRICFPSSALSHAIPKLE